MENDTFVVNFTDSEVSDSSYEESTNNSNTSYEEIVINHCETVNDLLKSIFSMTKEMENRTKRRRQHNFCYPESLKGTYTPIYAGAVLRTFFEASTGFGPLDPKQWKETGEMGPLLMDKLPFAKQGFMLRNTLTMLFFLYGRTMDLQEPENTQFSHFDDIMKKVFTEIPSTFYTAEGVPKMEMSDAIEKGLIAAPLSTQDVIRLKRPDFNDDKTPIMKNTYEGNQIYRKSFQNYFFQLLASNNYYSIDNLKANSNYVPILETINKKEVTESMILEHNIVKETMKQWNEYLEPSRKINREKSREVKNNTTISENNEITVSEIRKRI